MEEKNKKPEKKPASPMREWISDNLRYFMLIGAIAVVVIVVMVVLWMFAQGTSAGEEASVSSEASQSVSESVVEEETDEEPDTADDEADEDSKAEEAEEDDTADEAENESEPALTEATGDVTAVVSTYLNALADGDVSAAETVLEVLSDEDAEAIEQKLFANNYSNIEVYQYPGEEADSYVAFASYEYTYEGYDTSIPALTELYIITRDDGSLCIAADETQEAKSEYMSSILGESEITALIAQIQSKYDEALASDEALAEYIASIS